MRLIFAGTPPFAAQALGALADAGHDVALVLTQPDRPAGRGLKMLPSAVKQVALERGLALAQPTSLRDEQTRAELAAVGSEVMVVAAYGLLLPPAVLAVPARGCLNIHASLLPRWRGAAPVQRALLAGDAQTGVCIMQMDAGLDTGAVWARRTLAIGARETAGSLLARLGALGAQAIVETLATLDSLPAPQPQPAEGATYAAKIDKREAAVDFAAAAQQIDRQIRAFDPVPGAFCQWRGERLKLWQAQPESASAAVAQPGSVLTVDERGVAVACGEGVLWLQQVQRAGGQREDARQFARTQHLGEGARLESGVRA